MTNQKMNLDLTSEHNTTKAKIHSINQFLPSQRKRFQNSQPQNTLPVKIMVSIHFLRVFLYILTKNQRSIQLINGSKCMFQSLSQITLRMLGTTQIQAPRILRILLPETEKFLIFRTMVSMVLEDQEITTTKIL